jgi:hypothetical protein
MNKLPNFFDIYFKINFQKNIRKLVLSYIHLKLKNVKKWFNSQLEGIINVI